ncbi:MAG: hypothetical protein DA408_14700 [Bacteroidetes bacterium]|nr:MAG: hypothetical protein C7N36_21050 [Bacteroidota bacterium]PTM10951.1 MAG: hypothetical protein DA408_14700 [Bacteroidota bacterium]
MPTCNFWIDGKQYTAEAGTNLVDAARANGIFIPSLCYFPHLDPPLGTCRTCTCQINGRYNPACTESVREGLKVEVYTPELVDMRKALVEMMFAEGNHFCPACEKSGNCDLQHMGYELGISTSRFPHLFQDRLIDYRPERLVLEHNRCIKCRRCVEEVFTADGHRVFMYLNRGNETVVGIDYEQAARLSDAETRQAAKICPTGAILLRGKTLAEPFGNRTFDLHSVQSSYQHPISEGPPATPRKKKTIATVSLAGCFGCHMSMLDIDTEFLEVAELVTFNKSPLTDIKTFTQRCDLGIVEGGCANAENIETLRTFREMCDILVVMGECALWGGVPALRNTFPLGECLEEAYLHSLTSEPGERTIPYSEDLPKILNRVYGCHEIVEVDYLIPGCPPAASHIWKVVKSLLWGGDDSLLYAEFKYD